jgi:hypothetical protein
MTQYGLEVVVPHDAHPEYTNHLLEEAEYRTVKQIMSELSKTDGWLVLRMNQEASQEFDGTHFVFRLDVNRAATQNITLMDFPKDFRDYVALPSKQASIAQRLQWLFTGRIK